MHQSRWYRRDGFVRDTAESSMQSYSLRYMNEFVSKLQCAPKLLSLRLFPDAKEITESMGLFNAFRRCILPTLSDGSSITCNSNEALSDGIIVIGDGNTPRTAAMFALRMPSWKCFSIDPAMEEPSTSERAEEWKTIPNLVCIRSKIQDIQIRVRRAVIVLVHAHVSIHDAVNAVDTEHVVGIVTMPCCNWFGRQEEFSGCHPSLVYDDLCVFSDCKEIRVWNDTDVTGISEDFMTPSSCIPKILTEDKMDSKEGNEENKGISKELHKALSVIRKIVRPLTEQSLGVSDPALVPGIISMLKAKLKPEANILFFGDSKQSNPIVTKLFEEGFLNIFALCANDLEYHTSEDSCTVEIRRWSRNCDVAMEEYADRLSDVVCTCIIHRGSTDTGVSVKLQKAEGWGDIGIDCLVDAGYVYTGMRSEAKDKSLFITVCSVLKEMMRTLQSTKDPSMVIISPRKDWRKATFLAHPSLGLVVESNKLLCNPEEAGGGRIKPHYAYICSFTYDEEKEKVSEGDTIETNSHLFDSLQEQYSSTLKAIEQSVRWIGIEEAISLCQYDNNREIAAQTSEYLRVDGTIAKARAYQSGIAFFSLQKEGQASLKEQQQLQVLLTKDRMNWTPSFYSQVSKLLRRKRDISIVGFIGVSDRGDIVLHAVAMSIASAEKRIYT